MGPKVCPFIFRLAIENGSAAPTRKENAGWIRSCSEHPCQSTCSVLKAIKRQNALFGKALCHFGQTHRFPQHQDHHQPAECIQRDQPGDAFSFGSASAQALLLRDSPPARFRS